VTAPMHREQTPNNQFQRSVNSRPLNWGVGHAWKGGAILTVAGGDQHGLEAPHNV
jgi:hypothetical protein